jgi:hypothetical protein
MPQVGCTLFICTHSCMHRHTICKSATNLLHPQCMHAPCKQHSSYTHASLTWITDATYHIRKYAAEMQKTHNVCMFHANHMQHINAACHSYCILHAHYCYAHCTNLHSIHAYCTYPHMQANLLLHV